MRCLKKQQNQPQLGICENRLETHVLFGLLLMKLELRGRALQLVLDGGNEKTVSQLKELGFTPERALETAEAAIQFADEESARLIRQLVPKSTWPGAVLIRRHQSAKREVTWLMLKFENKKGWCLDSALFP